MIFDINTAGGFVNFCDIAENLLFFFYIGINLFQFMLYCYAVNY